MKLLIDMNLSPTWVTAFAEAGIEAVHWSSVGATKVTIDAQRVRVRILPLKSVGRAPAS